MLRSMCAIAFVIVGAFAEEPAKKPGVTGKIDGKEFQFVEALALPPGKDPDVIDVGVFQEDVDDADPFPERPSLMLRIPRAGGEAEFRGKMAATFSLPPSKSISARSGKVTVEKKADGSYTCQFVATAGEKNHLEGSVTLKAPGK